MTFPVAGVYVLQLTASDGALSSSDTVAITVTDVPPPTNVAPTVSAGADQAVTLPNAAALVGTATDDGRPEGSTLTLQWSLVSGPGAPTIVTPTSASTSVTFPVAGVYVLQLTASDGALSRSDTVAITVTDVPPPTNVAPTVSAGADQAVTLPNAAALVGTATDDGLPAGSTLTLVWSLVSGPGAPTIVTPTSASTSVTFSTAGAYVLQLTASDGPLSSSDTVTVVVSPAGGGDPEPTPVNARPTVDAGSDRSVTLPGVVTLAAQVGDDGLPGGSPLVLQWSQISGPGTATMVGPTSASTEVRFPLAGVYVFSLAATDGALAASDDVRVTVSPVPPPPNTAPLVDAGSDASITLPSAITLSATVTDDGRPAPARLVTTWSQRSGPGVAIISDPGSPQTSATTTVPGTYVFRVQGDDGVLAGADEVTVEVVAAPPPTNAAPTVTVTGDAQVALPQAGALRATVNDDGRPTAVPPVVAWTQVSGPGVAVFGAPESPTSQVTFSQPGSYQLRATASDGELTSSADVAVEVSPAPPLNAAPRVSVGEDLRAVMGTPLVVTASVTDDGLPSGSNVSTTWSRALGPGAVTFATPAAASSSVSFAMPGRYVLELTATDGELVGSAAVVVTVLPATDSDLLAPVITLEAPSRALPGQEVRVNARVSDDIGVADVAFSVDGDTRAPVTAAPFTTLVRLPDVVAPGQRVLVRGTVRDATGRTGSDEVAIEISVVPDVDSPALELRAPDSTVPGGTITALALAQDASGIARVEFFVDDVATEVDEVSPYELTLPVPPTRPAGPLAVRAEAVDVAGNRATATRVVQVATEADTTAPVITFDPPATAAAGSTIRVEALVSDTGGVADVRVTLSGLAVLESASGPWVADMVVPDVPAGSQLTLRVDARDLSGNASEITRTLEIVEPSTSNTGLITGQVVDDVTGLVVPSATVTLHGGLPGSAAEVRRTVLTSSDGRYEVDSTAGAAWLLVEKDGYVSSVRTIAVQSGQVVAALDARLTPRGTSVLVQPGVGQRLTAGAAQVDVPAGGVTAPTPVALASVSAQGLASLLPAGWAPLAAVQIGQDALSLSAPAILRLTIPETGPLGRSPALARWDAVAGAWRVTAADVAVVSGIAEQALTVGGQYALVLADVSPVAPPAPVAGALLSGVARATSADVAQSQVTPEPRVLFASPDARSLVGGQVTSTAPVSSGLILRTRLVESYRFLNGEQWQPPVRLQDVVLYQRPVDALTLSAHFPVGPSRAFEAIALERGVIGVELRTADGATGAGIAGAAGGTATGDGNLELVIPAGALGAPGQVAIRRVAVEDLGVPVPPGTTILDALDVVVPTTLARSAELSLPRAAGLVDATRVVLARLAEVNGRSRYLLAGLVELVGDRARVVLEVGAQPTGLPGVREAGTYVLLQASGPVGFATGRVVDPVGAAIIGAVVTPSTLPAVSVSDAAGRYFVAAPAGAVVLVAADERRGDRGERPAFLAAQVMTPLTLTVLPVPPQVTSIRPADAATGVLTDDPISVTFSEAILASTLTGAVRLVGPGDAEVAVTTALTRGGSVLEVRPLAPLLVDARYVLTIAAGITDLVGNGLPAAVTSAFETVDQNGPVVPPAGTITASVPDRGGRVTVKGTQGSAVPGTRVFVENVTRGTSVLALAGADGSFAAGVLAAVADRLRVRIVDASDNATIVDIETLRQLNPDGSIAQVVAETGGVVEGPGGTRATIKPGTFPGGTVVTMKEVPVAQFPRQLTVAEQENFSFEKAISLDFDGATPQQYIDVSWPASAGDEP